MNHHQKTHTDLSGRGNIKTARSNNAHSTPSSGWLVVYDPTQVEMTKSVSEQRDSVYRTNCIEMIQTKYITILNT